ncbi:acetyltransferase [Burkholderia ubonensis]|uniref:acyltransferase n=1 Tax=Burkholderia ubonensis TaxID=101571 RepID=UPI000756232D|nr:acyltransferase [Burkholderia ubonensis]KVO00168.1 acetyltransferase [Burkholderia ubonensis]
MIHQTALVSPYAKIGKNVQIGAFSIVHDDVVVGDDTVIENHCEIGYPTKLADGRPLIIGENSLIRSHSVFYAGSSFGERLITGHRVTVRELTVAGKNLQIGTLGDIEGHCSIGDYVRTHSNVHVGHGTKIGNFVWVFPYVVFTNDPHPPSEVCIGAEIGDYAAIATMSVVLPGVKVGEHSLVAAHSCVGKDVAPHTVVGGSPAKFLCETCKIKLRDGSNELAYPWPRHFHRGYPADIVDTWRSMFSAGEPSTDIA